MNFEQANCISSALAARLYHSNHFLKTQQSFT